MVLFSRARRGPLWLHAGALALAGTLIGCKQDVQLTKTAPVGPAPQATAVVKREPTTLSFAVPIDLAAAEAVAEAALPQSLGRVVEWYKEAACAKRNRWIECNGARADFDIERNGPVRLAAENGRIVLKVPLKYTLTARGLGWARDIQDAGSGDIEAEIPIRVLIATGFDPDVQFKDPVTLSQAHIAVLKAEADLGRLIDGRLKKMLAPMLASVREGIQAKDLRSLTEKAWRALHSPVALTREPHLWLRIEPERLAGIDFASEGGKLLLRCAISARLSATAGERPAPLLPRPMPELPSAHAERHAAMPQASSLQLPVQVGSEPLRAAIRAAFADKEVMTSLPDGSSEPIASIVRHVSLFQSRDLLGIELQLDIKAPVRWAGMVGAAHFVAKPVLRGETEIGLDGVGLPGSGVKTGRAVQRPQPSQPNVPRITAEPFAGRIANAGRMDISGLLAKMLPQANAMIAQPLGNGFHLGGQFEHVQIVGLQAIRDGFELTFNLSGTLFLRYAPEQAMAAPAQPPPSVR